MRKFRRDEIHRFENDFVVQQEGIVRLMVRSPDEAVLSVWRHDVRVRPLEGTHVLNLVRSDLEADWEPELFEGLPDWWESGVAAPGSRASLDVVRHPLLQQALDAALNVLSENDREVLEIGARRLGDEVRAVRARAGKVRPDLEVPKGLDGYALMVVHRYLDEGEIAALSPSMEAFGFGGILETARGPVVVQIETGPVVRIECLPLVPLVLDDGEGPVELRLSARRSAAGWDYVKATAKTDAAEGIADEILVEVERTWPEQIKAASAAWARTQLAMHDMVHASIGRKLEVFEDAALKLEARVEAAESRLDALTSSAAPAP